MLLSMHDAPLRLPAGGPTLTIEVGADFADVLHSAGGRYERHITALLPRLLPPDGVGFDVGANAGALTLSMAHLAPRGRVVAFEAAPANADRLEANLARAGFRNVRVERLALYDGAAELSLAYSDEHTGGASVSAGAPDPGTVTIPAVALDDWIAANPTDRVDVVKIDVEGSEVRVLRGARRTLRRFHPALIVECNPVTLGLHDHATTGNLLDVLDDLGYRLGWIVGRGGVIPLRDRAALDPILAAMGIVDLLCVAGRSPRGLRGIQPMLGRLRARHRVRSANRVRRPPQCRFVIGPALAIDVPAEPRAAPAGARIHVEVTLSNTGDGWLSSDFAPYPVLITHRWLDPAGAEYGIEPRTRLPRPIRPGDTCALTLEVDVPPEPGAWTLVVRAVQEGFAWLDSVAPDTPRRIPLVVTRPDRC